MLNKNLAYEASAGSGKTFMLVVRYLSLLFLGASPTKILALTFTNKAASEMQERIIQTLQELETRGELEEILKVTELSRIEILSKRKTILDDFLNSNVKIMTIDKFFAQILRKFSLYASLMPDFNTMSSQHELKLLSRFLKEVSVSGKRDSLITLSLESNKRVTDIFTLLDNFYSRFQELSHLKFQKQEYLHFEGLALDALDDLKHLIDNCSGASPTLKKAVEVDSFNALKEKSWVAKESLNYWVFKKCFTPEMDIHLRIIQENLKNHARAKEQNFFYALSDLVSIYTKAKQALFREDSELSFNDVTALVYYILKERIDSEFLYFRLDAQIVHILLDEFQDTSILQYSILKPLIDEILSGSGVSEDGSFFFVGDVKQSIYRFRGGVSALFHEVATDCDTDVEQLLVNYRSLKEVVEFVNRTFEPTIKNYTPQKVKEENESGFVEILQSEEILDETLTQVKRLIESGATLDDIAILCATNGDGESIKHHLEDDGLEVVTETTTKLINQTAVKALIEHLKYLYFSKDIYKHNFFALINQEPKDIMKQDLNGKNILTLSKSIIQEYKLAVDDSHLIRFLDVVSSYEDIEAFLFEYERQDASGASSELSGVRVLTIHKSKGLEYKHIIVMDRLKKAPPLRDAIIYEYDGIRLQNLYLRTKGRDGVDEEYATALQKEKTLAGEDSLNALYVAFTRARDNLIIVMKPKASSFEVLNLQVGSFGELKIQDDEDSPQEQPLALQKFEYKELYYGTQSDILRAESKADEDLKAINFGLALHYMLEMLDDFNKQSINNAKNMMINKYGYLLEPQEIQDITARVLMLVEDEKFISLSSKHYYKEKPLRYKKNLRYIDLLIKKDDGGYNIIDYKSSTAYKNHHNKQVINYVKAVKEITQKQVDGYICYLLDDKVKIVKV